MISGAQLAAGENIIIEANRDVNITTSTDKQNEHNKSSSKQTNITLGVPTAGSSIRFINGSPNHGVGMLPYGDQRNGEQHHADATAQNPSSLTANNIYINSKEGHVNM